VGVRREASWCTAHASATPRYMAQATDATAPMRVREHAKTTSWLSEHSSSYTNRRIARRCAVCACDVRSCAQIVFSPVVECVSAVSK
jgi:hypothetical protein